MKAPVWNAQTDHTHGWPCDTCHVYIHIGTPHFTVKYPDKIQPQIVCVSHVADRLNDLEEMHANLQRYVENLEASVAKGEADSDG